MKNSFKNAKTRNTNNCRASIFVFEAICIICAIILFGCSGSLQNIASNLDTASIQSLEPRAVDIIRQGLADPDPRIRANAVEAVANTHLSQLMPLVQQLLKDDFIPVRFAAALAVGDLEYHPAEADLQRLLKAPDENVRIAAAYAMTRLGHRESLELLGQAIASKDQTVRANAALLLGKTGDQSTLKLLHWARTDRDSDAKVRFQAVEAISRLGDERIFPKLWAMLISLYADDRVMAVKALGALGTPKAKDVLITKLDDEVLEVRLVTAEQLGRLGSYAGEPVVLDVFRKNLRAGLDDDELQRVNRLTALAIGQICTPRLTKFLPQLLRNESKFVRIAAANAVLQWRARNEQAEGRQN